MTWWVNMCFLHLTRLACAHFVTLQKNTYIVKINMRPLLYKHCHSQTQMSCIVLMWYIDSFAKDGLENIKWIYYLIGKFPPFSIFHFPWMRIVSLTPKQSDFSFQNTDNCNSVIYHELPSPHSFAIIMITFSKFEKWESPSYWIKA